MFIHCIFVGFKKIYKDKGYGSLLLHECINDAKGKRMRGVAVVTRKGAFMASNDLFIKHGFEVVDSASPDFELLVYRFNTKSPAPSFNGNWENRIRSYSKGLTIIRADQCPYTVKNVNEICETAKNRYKANPTVITLENCKEAQNSPAPFGTFCILYDGAIIAEHPISNTRFKNIMSKIVK
jgi:hypothetical protein